MQLSLVVTWAGAWHCKNVCTGLFSWHKTFSLPAQADRDKLRACSALARSAIMPRESRDWFHLREAQRGQAGVLPARSAVFPHSPLLLLCKQGKENKKSSALSPPPLCFQSCCPHRPCQGSDTHHSLAGGHVLGQGVFTADLGRGQLCHVEEELLFLASPCSVNWGMGSPWAHAKCHG